MKQYEEVYDFLRCGHTLHISLTHAQTKKTTEYLHAKYLIGMLRFTYNIIVPLKGH